MENIIYNELIYRGYNVDVGTVPFTSADSNGKLFHSQYEVDFVCNKASKRYYIQSAFSIPDSIKMEQETNSLSKIDDSFKKIILVKDTPAPYYTDKGIIIMGIFDFLLDENSLSFLKNNRQSRKKHPTENRVLHIFSIIRGEALPTHLPKGRYITP